MSFLSRWTSDIGLDLGTSNTLVYVQNRGIVLSEPSVVAINTRTDTIMAIGTNAKKMLGKSPAHVSVVRPLMHGIVSNFEVAERMLSYLLGQVIVKRWFALAPRVVVGIPVDITEVERKAVEDAVLSAGAGKVFLVEEAVAAAIGSRLPITEAAGNMVVDIGGGTTEISVISLGGVVASRSLKLGGDKLTESIIAYVRERFNTIIGEATAEEIKMKLGTALPTKEDVSIEVRGRNVINGLPQEFSVSENQVHEAISKHLDKIMQSVKETLERTPPELGSDIHTRGIVVSGGGALLRSIAEALSKTTGVPVRVADDPLTAVVRGTGILLEQPELLELVTISSVSR